MPSLAASEVQLTPEELLWLEAHPDIVLGGPTTYPPFIIENNDGTHVGLMVDFFEVVSSLLDHRIRLHIEDPWKLIQEKAQKREIDGLALGAESPIRAAHFNSTEPMFSTYYSVFARAQGEYQVRQLSDVEGLRVGIREGSNVPSMLEGIHLADLKVYGTNEALTQALLSREVDVVVSWISYDFFRKTKLQGTIDNILLIEEHPIEMVTHIRKDWPEFVSIMNKAIFAMKQDKLPSMLNRWFIDWPQETQRPIIKLTPEEKAWLDENHDVRVRVGNAPPWEINSPEPGGMSVEYLEWIGERFGINFLFIADHKPWIEGFQDLNHKQERFDLYPAAQPTSERLESLAMSDEYLHSPWVVFVRDDVTGIYSINDLDNRAVTVERGYAMHKKLEDLFPIKDLRIKDNTEEALLAVSLKDADAYVGNLIVTSYLIEQLGLTNIKIACPTPYGMHSQAVATRKEWAPLISIINKGLSSMPASEKLAIHNRYSTIKYEHGFSYGDLIKWGSTLILSAFGIITSVLIWNKQLSRKVAARTAELQESESRFRSTFEQAAVGVAHVSLKGEFIRFNRTFCEIVGYPEEELVNLTFQDITHPDDLKVDLDNIEKVKNGNIETYSLDKRYCRKDGSIVWANLTVSMLFDKQGNSRYFVAVIKNIAARKQAEESLRQSFNFQEHLTTSVPDAIFSIKMPDRVIQWANDSYNILGYEPKECVGKSTKMFYSNPAGYLEFGSLLEKTINDGNDVLLSEAMLRRKSGEIFPAEINISLYREAGEVVSVTTLIRDITVRKQAETELHASYREIEHLQMQLQAESCYLQEEIKVEHNYENIIGNSDAIQYALFKVEQVAKTDSTVLILGETGTGKELIARAIHHNSKRADRPLVKVNCATLPPELIENELFGHEKGSFTGAIAKHTGKFEVANGSTLFLDEIGEMPIELQAKLLRVIEDGEFERLGSTKTIKVDVRIIAATNRDLQKDVREGLFRGDLLYRLNVFPITLPPLRDRLEDIPLLVQHYLALFNRKLGKNIDTVPVKVMNNLQAYNWPGNVRELQNAIERAVIATSGRKLQFGDFFQEPLIDNQSDSFKSMSDIEREYIVRVLEKTNWKVSGKNSASEILCLDRSTLRARMKRLGIQRPLKKQ